MVDLNWMNCRQCQLPREWWKPNTNLIFLEFLGDRSKQNMKYTIVTVWSQMFWNLERPKIQIFYSYFKELWRRNNRFCWGQTMFQTPTLWLEMHWVDSVTVHQELATCILHGRTSTETSTPRPPTSSTFKRCRCQWTGWTWKWILPMTGWTWFTWHWFCMESALWCPGIWS